jgi:hypothetical protein
MSVAGLAEEDSAGVDLGAVSTAGTSAAGSRHHSAADIPLPAIVLSRRHNRLAIGRLMCLRADRLAIPTQAERAIMAWAIAQISIRAFATISG